MVHNTTFSNEAGPRHAGEPRANPCFRPLIFSSKVVEAMKIRIGKDVFPGAARSFYDHRAFFPGRGAALIPESPVRSIQEV